MNYQSLDLSALYKYVFHQFQKYASFIIGAALTYLVLSVLPQVYYLINVPSQATTQSEIVSVIITLVQLLLSLGFTKIMLLLIQDEYVEVADLFNNFSPFISYAVASFIFGIAVALGFILLVIPGIFVLIRFQFFPYFILEHGDSSFTALQKSYYLSEGYTIELLIFGLTVIALNLGGILFFGVGLIFTYPVTTMATAVVYKSLSADSDAIPSDMFKI